MHTICVNGHDDVYSLAKEKLTEPIDKAQIEYSFVGGKLDEVLSKVRYWNSELEEAGVKNIEQLVISISKGTYSGAIILVEQME
jgi:hypothetical protein